MARLVLYQISDNPGEPDVEVAEFELAPIEHSSGYPAYSAEIATHWGDFLELLDDRLRGLDERQPRVTNRDVLRIRGAIEGVVEEALGRVLNSLAEDPAAIEEVRDEAAQKFGFYPALQPDYKDDFARDVKQLLRFGTFVIAQKLVLYRVLEESGQRKEEPFRLDPIEIPSGSSDPAVVEGVLDAAWGHAIKRSGDFESAFLPKPMTTLVFTRPGTSEEEERCRVGAVWSALQKAVSDASWVSISRNLVGFLYEMIVDPMYRHELGQYYTREDVVDLLTAFAIRDPSDTVMDPACGGGSFLWSAYRRKRDLGDTHELALEAVWGFEITSFAAELSTIALATADAQAAAAYPRVVLSDFFDARPSAQVDNLVIPDLVGAPTIPESFDAVVGNPPYISYRRITNQSAILEALASMPREIDLPKFSGKSDVYTWFVVHATRFLSDGGRMGFVLSSAILFSDYGVPLIRFIGRHFKVVAVIDSMVERWFPEADTNTILLLLERESDPEKRRQHEMRFVRLRRPLQRLIPGPENEDRRQLIEDLVDVMCHREPGPDDPRVDVRALIQGDHAGLDFVRAVDDGEGGTLTVDDTEEE